MNSFASQGGLQPDVIDKGADYMHMWIQDKS